ncbi:MAG: ABC transporter ATP-binding protein [Oligoflexia bacterium]|nr:ABC transporter ATP-binding protein [Oligoflexia bacterium]
MGLIIPVIQGTTNNNPLNNYLKQALLLLGIPFSLPNILIVLVLLILFKSILMILMLGIISTINANLSEKIRLNLFQKIFKINYQYFAKFDIGLLNNAISGEIGLLVSSFKIGPDFLMSVFFSFAYILIPIILKPSLVCIFLVLCLLIYPLILKLNRLEKTYSRKTTEYSGEMQKILIQAFQFYKYLKATRTYQTVIDRIIIKNKELCNIGLTQQTFIAISGNLFEPLIALIIFGAILYQVNITSIPMVEYAYLLFLMARALQYLIYDHSLIRAEENFEKYKENNNHTDNKIDHENFVKNNCYSQIKGSIEFKNISFAYEFTKKNIFKNLNFIIPEKSVVAFVGKSGAGKTTIVNLLLKLVEAQEGEILIDGISYSMLHRDYLRNLFAYVGQEKVIFNDTILNNIVLFEQRENINQKQLEHSINFSGLKEFVADNTLGLNTKIEGFGQNISGRQRQRICMDREFYKDKPIIIVDEATNSLDVGMEEQILKNILSFKGEKTIILISHNISSLKECDLIYVIENETILKSGKYEQIFLDSK